MTEAKMLAYKRYNTTYTADLLVFLQKFHKRVRVRRVTYSKFKCSIYNTGFIKIFSVKNKKNDPKIAKDLK